MVHKQITPDTTLIHNDILEQSMIYLLLSSYQAFVDTQDILNPDCFFNETYRNAFLGISAVARSGNTPDFMLVAEELKKLGIDMPVIDIVNLSIMPVQFMHLDNFRLYALLLLELSHRRALIQLGVKLSADASLEVNPVEDIHSDAKNALDAIFNDNTGSLLTLDDAYSDMQKHIAANIARQDGQISGSPTGFPELDRNGGLNPTDLIVIGAESSQGKTAFSTAIVLSAIEAGHGVAFYSMEMSPLQICSRIAAMKSGIPSSEILYQKLDAQKVFDMYSIMDALPKDNLFFDARSTSSLDSILLSIRRMKLKHNIKGAVIDYLQLVKTADRSLNREQATAQCARDLKNIAKELGIWVIAISQLSRNQQNPVPSMSRLRDSGQIEEAADNVILIYRPRDASRYPEPFADITTSGTAMITIAKGRNIGTSQFICGFDPSATRFYPIEIGPEDKFTGQRKLKGLLHTEEILPF